MVRAARLRRTAAGVSGLRMTAAILLTVARVLSGRTIVAKAMGRMRTVARVTASRMIAARVPGMRSSVGRASTVTARRVAMIVVRVPRTPSSTGRETTVTTRKVARRGVEDLLQVATTGTAMSSSS